MDREKDREEERFNRNGMSDLQGISKPSHTIYCYELYVSQHVNARWELAALQAELI